MSLFSIRIWICVFIGIFFVMWLCFGNRHHNYQVDYPWSQQQDIQISYQPSPYRHQQRVDIPIQHVHNPQLNDLPYDYGLQVRVDDYVDHPLPNFEVSPRLRRPQSPILLSPPSYLQSLTAIPTINPHPVQPVHHPNFVADNTTGRSIGEAFTCGALEEILGRPVSRNVRLPEMINPLTGKRIELDCFDPVTGIAAEYNGRQHYEFPNAFMTTPEQFQAQLYRDQLKRQLCDDTNKYLIPVPYTVDMCVIDSTSENGYRCKTSVPKHERQRRIRGYMREKVDEYYTLLSQMQ
jgi:hypothetical protein